MTATTCTPYRTHDHTTTTRGDFRGPVLALDERTFLPLEGTITRIGRRPGSDLELDDHSVSHRHAVIINSPVGVVLLDDRSVGGTYVNGVRVTRRTLEPGDEIRLGRVTFQFLR